MTVTIDPQQGDDAGSGLSRDQAWRGFAPLRELRLGPGDRVEVLPGAFDTTLALCGHGTAEHPVEVHLAPGRYDLDPAHALRRRLDISNCNDDAEGLKAIGILVEDSRHVRIAGPGARVVFRGKMIELCIERSESVTVEGLQFDYHRPTVSEYRVVSAGDSVVELAVHPDSAYVLDARGLRWIGEGWEYATGLAQELDPQTDVVRRRRDPLEGLRVEELSSFRLRAHGPHDLIAGRVIQLRDTFRDCVGFFLHRNRDLVLRDLDVRFLHGMGILGQFSENITLDQVRIAPDPAGGRTSAAWADCTHFSGCRGRIVLRDCLFLGAHDDAANVHGTYLRIVRQEGVKRLRLRFMHRQTFGFPAFLPGDEIEFVRSDSLAMYAANRVTAAELDGPKDLLLTLESPMPSDWREGDAVENVTWTPEVEIRRCTVRRIPTRGFLLTTRRRVRVADCTFVHLRVGIHVENDAEGWYESGPVRDMEIRSNRFLQCARAGVCISPHNRIANHAVHRNIRIVDNEFLVPAAACAVEARGTTGLTVTGNRFRGPRPTDPAAGWLRIDECADVAVDGNSVASAESAPLPGSIPAPPTTPGDPLP